MQLIYEGKDITGDVDIRQADLIDNAGGKLDSLDLTLDDSKGYWSQWKPEKNHTLQVKDSGFNSGVMYVDEIVQQRGEVTLRALPIKQEAKTPNTKAYEKVQFLEIARIIASKYNLSLQTYGVTDYMYSRVDQSDQADLEFLALRCLMESCSLKISGGKLIIYGQPYMENQAPYREITINDIDGDFVYLDKSTEIFGACRVTSNGIEGEFSAPDVYGPALKYFDLAVGSIGEANRFATGLLRAKNCTEKTFSCQLRFDPGIAAGNTVQLSSFGLADGKYFAHQVIHRFIEGKTSLRLRKPLEGY